MKNERNIQIRTKFVKLGVNKTLVYVNQEIQSEDFESNNKTTTFMDKEKQTSSAYDIKGIKNTSSKSKKKEKVQDGYVNIYECG